MRRSCYLIILFIWCLAAKSQNNPFGIEDDIYPLFRRAMNGVYNKNGIQTCDSLIKRMSKMNDKKGLAMSYFIKAQCIRYNCSDDEYEKKCKEYMAICRKLNYLPSYYQIWQNFIIKIINNSDYNKALAEVEKFKTSANKDNYTGAIAECYILSGSLYEIRRLYGPAIEQYKKAYEIEKKIDIRNTEYPAMLIGFSSYERHDYVNARKYIELSENALQEQMTPSKQTFIIFTAMTYIEMNRMDEAEKIYKKIHDYINNPNRTKSISDKMLIAEIQIHHNEIDSARKTINGFTNKVERYRMLSKLYHHENNMEEALKYQKMYSLANDSIHDVINSMILADYNARLGNDQLTKDKQTLMIRQLEYQRSIIQEKSKVTSLNLINRELELGSQKALLAKERSENMVKQQKRQNEIDKEKAKRIQEHSELMRLKTESHTKNIAYIIGISIKFLLTVSFFIIEWIIKTKNKKLIRTHKDLIKARRRAEETDALKTTFIQNMSHEIRTPLNAISGFSQIIANDSEDLSKEEKKRFSELIISNSELISVLVNDVLTLSKLENSEYDIKYSEVNPNKLCLQALDNVKNRCPEGVKMHFLKELDDAVNINSDSRRIIQVLVNYLSNACKHTNKGEIRIGCNSTENPGCITFFVEDTGEGVPADKAEIIFKRFEKLDNFKQGGGLGLCIVRTIAKNMNATAKLDTSYEGGGRFVFILPTSNKKEVTLLG